MMKKEKRIVRKNGKRVGGKSAATLRRRKKRRKFKIRTGCLNFFVLLLLFITTILLMFLSPYFNIKYIDVLNIENISHEHVLMTAQISVGDNIFKVNTNNAEKRILTIPYVDDVKIKRKLPFNKLEINIIESDPMAKIHFGGGFIIIDKNGKLLESIDINDPKTNLTLIHGINLEGYEIGAKIKTDNKIMEKIQLVFDEINKYGLKERLTLIDVSDEYNIMLELDSNKNIKLGDTYKISHKILMLTGVLKEVGINESGDIDLNYDNKVIFSPS